MVDVRAIVLEMLVPIFPNLTKEILQISVNHPSNQDDPPNVQVLLQKCIDDLLELRTFTENTSNPVPYRQPDVAIHSDDSENEDGDKDTSNEDITLHWSVKSTHTPTKINTSQDVIITDHTPAKDVEITGHTLPKDCLIVSETSRKKVTLKVGSDKPIVKEALFVSSSDKPIVKEAVFVSSSDKPKQKDIHASKSDSTIESNSSKRDNVYREIDFSSDSNSSTDLFAVPFDQKGEGKGVKLIADEVSDNVNKQEPKVSPKIGSCLKPKKTTCNMAYQPNDIYREIEFSSDSNSSDLPAINYSSDEDVLPTLKTPTKNSPIKAPKFESKFGVSVSSPDFSNWRDGIQKPKPGPSAVNTDKLILHGRNELLERSQTVPNILATKSPGVISTKGSLPLTSKKLKGENRGMTVNVNNTSEVNVNITFNVGAQSMKRSGSETQISSITPSIQMNKGEQSRTLTSVNNLSSSNQTVTKNSNKMPQNNTNQRVSVSNPQVRPTSPTENVVNPASFNPAINKLMGYRLQMNNLTLPPKHGLQGPEIGNPTLPPKHGLQGPQISNPTLPPKHGLQGPQISNPTLPPKHRLQGPQISSPTLPSKHVVSDKDMPPGVPKSPNMYRSQTIPQGSNLPRNIGGPGPSQISTINRPPFLNPVNNFRPQSASSTITTNNAQAISNMSVMNRPPTIPSATVTTSKVPANLNNLKTTATIPNKPPGTPTATVTDQNRPKLATPDTVIPKRPNLATADTVIIREDPVPVVGNEVTVIADTPVINIDHRPPQAPATNIQAPVVIPDVETPEMKIRKAKDNLRKEVMALFPDVDPVFVDEQYDRFRELSWSTIINNVCNTLLENPQYPRKKAENNNNIEVITKTLPNIDYYKEFSEHVCATYRNQCETLLQSEFKWISLKDIRSIMKCFNGHYAPSHRVISSVMQNRSAEYAKIKETQPYIHPFSQARTEVKINGVYGERTLMITFLKCGRPNRSMISLCPELVKEKDFIEIKTVEEIKEADHMLAITMNESEYEESGQLIECGCCYGEVAFENMVQCYEGHLFCQDCLERYAKESVFGHGKAALTCMTDGCDATYPTSQLQKALPSNILSKYEDRVQEESINLADLTDLVRCPHCEFAALMDPGDKVFKCYNQSCLKETCRHCKEDWTEHFGKRCEEIEKKDEVKLRLQFEEKMTEAKIRTCHKCKAKFTKSDGCNKMTCRCGGKMCYICRKPNIDYGHFCRHFRDPNKGKACEECTACSLWTNPEEDDERAVAEIRKEAEEKRKEMGYVDEKLIGAPDEPPSKKQKLVHPGQPQVRMV